MNYSTNKIMKRTNLLEEIQAIAVKSNLMVPEDGKLIVTIWVEQYGSIPDGSPEGSPILEHCYAITKEN